MIILEGHFSGMSDCLQADPGMVEKERMAQDQNYVTEFRNTGEPLTRDVSFASLMADGYVHLNTRDRRLPYFLT